MIADMNMPDLKYDIHLICTLSCNIKQANMIAGHFNEYHTETMDGKYDNAKGRKSLMKH